MKYKICKKCGQPISRRHQERGMIYCSIECSPLGRYGQEDSWKHREQNKEARYLAQHVKPRTGNGGTE